MNSDNIKFQDVDFNPFEQDLVPTTEPQREILANIFIGGHAANCSYNESVSLHLHGDFNIETFRKTIPIVIQRHQALNSLFSTDGFHLSFSQVIHDDVPLIDITNFSPTQRSNEVQAILDKEAETAFDVHNGPLYRFLVIRHSPALHQVILSFHHIVCDGWSLGIIMQDLGKIYSSLRSGIEPDLPPSDSFAGFIQEEQAYQESGENAETEAFWIQKFKNNLPAFEFPPDKSRPAVRTFNAHRVDVEVDTALVENIRKTASKMGVSYVSMLTAAFEIFLFRVTGLSDIVLALPAAGQSATGHHNLIGHCVNVLPLRTNINPESKFSEYIKERKSSLLDAYDHQRFTFGSLVKKLNIPRDPSRIPLVPVAFNLDIGITDGVKFEGCTFEFSTNPRHYENFEIFINASGNGNKLILECTHNTDLFDSQLMQMRMQEFLIMLQSAILNTDTPVSQLNLITEKERELIFEQWNAVDKDFSSDLSLSQWFENTSEKFPGSVALTFDGKSMNYGELNTRANQLANQIDQLGIAPGSFIGILTGRNFDLVISILGVLKARCVYVPVDPSYPPERIKHILSDASCPLILVSSHLKQQVPESVSKLLIVDENWAGTIGKLPDSNPGLHAAPSDPAYIIYTSGSTGKPKGTLVTHSNVTRLFTATEHWYHFNEKDVWTLFHSAAFDFSVWEIWGALLYGGRLVIVSYDTSRDPENFYDLVTKENVTVLNQTPSAFRTFTGVDKTKPNRVSSLRYVIFGGEALETESLRPWFNNHNDNSPQLVNMYGITETTVHVTYRPININDLDDVNKSMIGIPIPDLQVYILDDYQQPVPIGIPGEMYVGGAGVSKGYLNRSDLTSQRFLFNEFNPFVSTSLYRTGDLARYTLKGDIEYLGRIDNQVKIRGFRIELGEIESVIQKYPHISNQVVIAREDQPGDKRLVAYVVPFDKSALNVSDLREYMKLQLPEYMIPSAFIIIDSIPVTSNGKVDRKALPAPEFEGSVGDNFEEPKTPLEEMLAHIWCDVLGVYKIGRNDNFFEMGGHSILGVKMFNEVERQMGVKMHLPQLFGAPTIRDLASIINQEGLTKPLSCLVPLQSKGSRSPLFCIHMHNGNVNRWRVLVKHLGNEQPIYAIQPVGLDSNREPHHTIEEMAEHYIGVMKEVQPKGPYNLIGLCFSGMVVFEMAARLQKLGESVAFLGMVNNYAPPPNPTIFRIKTGIDKFMKLEMGEKFAYAVEKNLNIGKKLLGRNKSIATDEKVIVEDIQIDVLNGESANDLRTIHSVALLNYNPQHVYNGDLYIFRTDDPIEKYFNEFLGWDRLVKGVIKTTIIDGCDNDTIITDEPYNVILSEKIKEYLQSG